MNIARKLARKYELQNFTEVAINTNTTGASSTGNNLSAEMKTLYNTQLIRMAEPNLKYRQFAKKVPVPRGKGKTVEWRKWDSFAKATTPLTEGVTPSGNKLNVSTLTATVNQYGDYTCISDMLQLTAVDNVIMEATQAHASQAARTLDTISRNELMTGTNVFYCPKVVGTTVTEITSRASLTNQCLITPDVIAKVAAILAANNAPKIDGSYVGIVHPYVKYDLMRNDEWIDVNQYSNAKAIFKGEIGELYGVRFVESSEAKIWVTTTGSGDNAVDTASFGTVIFGDGAYGDVDLEGGNLEIIVKQKGSAGSADPLDQRSTVGWKAAAVTKILIPEYLYRIESGSAFSGSAVAN